MNAPFMSLSHAYALYRSDPHAPAKPTRTRSPTLPLDEDAGGETNQGTENKQSRSIYDIADHELRVSAASKATTRRLRNGKLKARPVLKPISSRISKQAPNERSPRRRISKQQHEAKYLGEEPGDSQRTRQDDPQDSNYTHPATLPTHQVDQPGNLTNQPSSPDRQVQPYRASIAPHPKSAQRAVRRRTEAPKSKLFTKINAESPNLSMVYKRRRRNPAQEASRSKQEITQQSPQEYKTKSGRVSKRPERLGST